MTNALLDAARDLRSEIDARAAKAEGGPIAAETVTALYDAGLYGAMIPAAVGGFELDIASCLDIFAEVARADGSVGWCLMASQSAASYFAAFCDDALVDRVFGGGIPLVAGQFAPQGTLRPVGESDWVLNGSYRFGSGMNDAQWAGAGAITEPRDGENPSYRFVIMPRSDVELEGGWDVMGLQSTASWDYRATDVAVPDNATFDFFFPHRYRGGTMYDMGVLPLTAAGHAGWAIGLIRRALDELRVMATTKKRMASKGPMRDSEWIQMRLGHLEARAAAATAWTYQSFRALEAQCADGNGPDEALVRDARMATAFVNHEGADIIRDAYTLAGTDALRDGGLQRAFRDIHAGTQHAVVSESVTQDYGAASIASAPGQAIDA
jgi:alkylation response protein AidB-like acyl-CoA dehydrogenase